MSRLIADKDWSLTPLGPPVAWPLSLRTAVNIALASRYPTVIFWGSELRMLFNDAYLPILGFERRKEALGERAEIIAATVWEVARPLLEGALAGRANAAKFTPEEGKISVSLMRADGWAVVQVADTGLGIDPVTLKRLFEPFAQADRSLDRSRGRLGLGLALVKGMVELHGGEVSAYSDGPGKGSRFTVKLPLVERAVAADGPAQPSDAASKGCRKVLIIEDNKDAADSLSEVLGLSGHRVAVAYDGAAGLVMAREFRPEIIICDIGLPGDMDGYAVARALRRDAVTASAFLIALTGYAQPEDRRQALAAGFDAHMAKPPSPEKLEEILGVLEVRS
jgi:CheY-like chemotaxis protein